MKRIVSLLLILLLILPTALAETPIDKSYTFTYGTSSLYDVKLFDSGDGLILYLTDIIFDYNIAGEKFFEMIIDVVNNTDYRVMIRNNGTETVNGKTFASSNNAAALSAAPKTELYNVYKVRMSAFTSAGVSMPYNFVMPFSVEYHDAATYDMVKQYTFTEPFKVLNVTNSFTTNLTSGAYEGWYDATGQYIGAPAPFITAAPTKTPTKAPTKAPTAAPTKAPATTNTATKAPTATTAPAQIKATKVKLSKSSAKLDCGNTIALTAKLTPTNASKNITWTSSNTSVATVNANGVVTAVKPGKATITAKAYGGKTAKCTITVNPITIKLNKKSAKLDTGKGIQLTAKVNAKSAEYSKVTWITSNASVATVDANGYVTAVKPGKATITAKAYGGKTAKCTITVNPITIKLNKKSAKLEIGTSLQLVPKVNTADARYSVVTYKSSKPDVATVDANGKVTALKQGKATITATAYGGKTAKCTITVNPLKVKSISSDCPTQMAVGQKQKINVSFFPENASVKTLTFKTSNKNVLAIDKAGVLTAKKAGTAKITITPKSNTKAKITVSVTVK